MADCNCTSQPDCETKSRKTPVCPDCGALECLCRPRFFAGQLLSEQDLNRLDRYIKQKNRLHTHNLHGWGVVNGLVVLCDPCDQIKVTKGYAVDPCGDDIVVCEDTAVDICKLIRQCKEKERQDLQCQPFQRPAGSNCDDLEEEWVLAIRYCEWPSRGVSALRNIGVSGNTAGYGSCGCGTTQRTQPRGAPTECEPTLTCEGYVFEVYRKPPEKDPGSDDNQLWQLGGPLADRFNACYRTLLDTIPTTPGDGSDSPENILANRDAWQLWCCQFRENLIRYYRNHDSTNCQLLQTLACIICPDPDTTDGDTFVLQVQAVISEYVAILAEGLIDCVCLTLLPPAPQATQDVRVPLATVKIKVRDCKIVSVCNWTMERKFMSTWPTMCYWWSLFPIGRWLHQMLEQACCREYASPDCNRQIGDQPDTGVVGMVDTSNSDVAASGNFNGVAMKRMNPTFGMAHEANAFAEMASLSMARGTQPLNPRSLLNSISRLNLTTNAPRLSELERNNLPQFLAMNLFARPMGMAAMQPNVLMNLLGAFSAITPETETESGTVTGLGSASGSASVNAELLSRLADLEKRVIAQEKTIKTLKSKGQ